MAVNGTSGADALNQSDRPRTGLINSPVFDAVLYEDGILADGSRGYAVRVLQTALKRVGFALRGGADGHFGPATRSMVMHFQREHGLIPTGLLERETLLVLDRKLQQLDRGDRTEALPPPRPLRGLASTYLETDEEREAYEAARHGLYQIRDRATTAPEASADDLLAVIARLEELPPPSYRNALRALSATREANPWAPTLLDLLLALPATISDDVELRERLCVQIMRKIGTDRGGAANVLTHISPDSVSRLRGAPTFPQLLRVLG